MATVRTHYDNLKVARDAPPEVIRAAYKVLSQRYHPDRNEGDPRAAHAMKVINTSYAVLSDPDKRRAHDAWIAKQERASQEQEDSQRSRQQSHSPPPPPPPPRRTMLQGALNHGARFWPAYVLGSVLLWVAIADPGARPSASKPYQATPPSAQAAAPSAIKPATCVLVGNYSAKQGGRTGRVYRCESSDGVRSYSNKLLEGYELVEASGGEPAERAAATNSAGTSAVEGGVWPTKPAYIAGLPRLNLGGLSTLTVDNSQNTSDVFVKLVSLDSDRAFPVRQFFIPRANKFVVREIQAGSYDLRYRDLSSGALSRSEQFLLEEVETSEGTQYSEMTMTLYQVRGGNLQTYALSESEF